MEKEFTQEEKVKMFNERQYAFPPPPVCHARWSTADWIKYIDSKGVWRIKKEDDK